MSLPDTLLQIRSARFELYYTVKKELNCMFLFAKNDCNY